MAAAIVAWIALSRGGLPKWAGGRPDGVGTKHDWKIYTGVAISIPIFALLVSGFSPFTKPSADAVLKTKDVLLQERVAFLEKLNVDAETVAKVEAAGISVEPKLRGETFKLINQETIESVKGDGSSLAGTIAGIFLEEVSKPAGLVLTILGILAFGYLIIETFKLNKVQRERMIAALVLIFFQMLFFAFFEQAGSSVNNFTDRNIDRVGETTSITDEMVGTTVRIEPTQAQLGYQYNSGKAFTNSDLDQLRKIIQETDNLDKIEVNWNVVDSNIGMGIATRLDELPASIFQSFNAIFILIFALIFNWLWSALRRRNMDPSAPIKFGLGLIQLGLGFGAFWLGAQNCTSVGMVAISWLTLGILLQTTGELCLSPVGLSTMTKLSPKVLVSTLMGAWFLATAFSQYLAAIISQFTSVAGHGGGGSNLPAPKDTVNVYGDVFGSIALTAIASGVLCIILSPILKKWMHEGVVLDEDGNPVESEVSLS
jgi:POT family proton-dependent oligopeptide transporter